MPPKMDQDESDQYSFEQAESSFIEFAKHNATPIVSLVPTDDNGDLEAIAKAIGNAKVVVLGEGFHNCREMMSLHHRIIRYLVEHHGFNTVMTETGLPESRITYDYVQGKEISTNVWERGLVKFYGAWLEGRELIEYMRMYNRTHDNILQYYGTDIGGFYQNWKTPLETILQYLETVDTDYHATLFKQLNPFMGLLANNARLNYSEQLSPSQNNELAAILDEAVATFHRKEVLYTSRSTKEDFQWARQSMIAMQLAENYYRNYDNRKHPESSKYVGLNGREIAMARNALWVLQQRKDAKVIWIEHVIHTKTKSQYQDEMWGFFTPAAQILKQFLRDDLFVIGMTYGGGKFWNKWQTPSDRFIDSIPPWDNRGRSLEKSLNKCGINNFFLHWATAPLSSAAQNWIRKTFSMRENDYFIQIEPSEWDSCIYLDIVGPATAAASSV